MSDTTNNPITININPTNDRKFYHDIIDAIFNVIDKYRNHNKENNQENQKTYKQEKINQVEDKKEKATKTYSDLLVPSFPIIDVIHTEEKLPEPEKQEHKIVCTDIFAPRSSRFKGELKKKLIDTINEVAKDLQLSQTEFWYRVCMKLGICMPSTTCKRLQSYINYEFKKERNSSDCLERHADCAILILSGMTGAYAELISRSGTRNPIALDKVPASMITEERLVKFYLSHKECIDDYIKRFPGKFQLPSNISEIERKSKEPEQKLLPKANSIKPLNLKNLTADIVRHICAMYEQTYKETSFVGDKLIETSIKNAGYKVPRNVAKLILFGHRYKSDDFKDISTPVYVGMKETTVQPDMIREIAEVKWLRDHNFSVKEIADKMHLREDWVENVYYEIIYTQVGSKPCGFDDRKWTEKYLNQ